MAQEQSHATDAERGRLILGDLIKSVCQRVAVEKGGIRKNHEAARLACAQDTEELSISSRRAQ